MSLYTIYRYVLPMWKVSHSLNFSKHYYADKIVIIIVIVFHRHSNATMISSLTIYLYKHHIPNKNMKCQWLELALFDPQHNMCIGQHTCTGISLDMRPANERRRYNDCNDVSHWLGAYLDWSMHVKLSIVDITRSSITRYRSQQRQ